MWSSQGRMDCTCRYRQTRMPKMEPPWRCPVRGMRHVAFSRCMLPRCILATGAHRFALVQLDRDVPCAVYDIGDVPGHDPARLHPRTLAPSSRKPAHTCECSTASTRGHQPRADRARARARGQRPNVARPMRARTRLRERTAWCHRRVQAWAPRGRRGPVGGSGGWDGTKGGVEAPRLSRRSRVRPQSA